VIGRTTTLTPEFDSREDIFQIRRFSQSKIVKVRALAKLKMGPRAKSEIFIAKAILKL
jgi:hypothetical protein